MNDTDEEHGDGPDETTEPSAAEGSGKDTSAEDESRAAADAAADGASPEDGASGAEPTASPKPPVVDAAASDGPAAPAKKKGGSRTPRRKKKLPVPVQRGPRTGRGLDPDLVKLASGEESRLFKGRRKTRVLKDDRPNALVPGVANRASRRLYLARLEDLKDATEETIGLLLAEAMWLGLWRGQSLTGFEALVTDVLGREMADVVPLARAAAEKVGLPFETLENFTVAVWMRVEDALVDGHLPGRIHVSPKGLHLLLDVQSAPEALVEMSFRLNELVADLQEANEFEARKDAERAERAARRAAIEAGEEPPPSRFDKKRGGFKDRDDRGGKPFDKKPRRDDDRGRGRPFEKKPFDKRDDRGGKPKRFDDRGPKRDDRGPKRFDDRGPKKFDDRGPKKFDDRRGPKKFDDRGGPGKKRFDDRGGPGKKRFDDRGPKRFDDRDDRGGPGKKRFDDRGPKKFDDRGGPGKKRFDDRGPKKFDDRGGPKKRFDDRGPSKKRFDDRGKPGDKRGGRPGDKRGGKPFEKKKRFGDRGPSKPGGGGRPPRGDGPKAPKKDEHRWDDGDDD